jgi:hypothetical protein
MLANADRSRGFRARMVLDDNGLGDVARLPAYFRDNKIPETTEEITRLRRRHNELLRELEVARTEMIASSSQVLDSKYPTPHYNHAHAERAKAALVSFEAAERRAVEAGRAVARAREAWEPERRRLTKELLEKAAPTLVKAFSIIAGDLDGDAELKLLYGLAGELELKGLRPIETDGRVTLATMRILGQALDEYWQQCRATGLRWGRPGDGRSLAPSKTLAKLVS